ncbi:MAG: hypothetical protein ACK5OX_09255 [Desertimonas sp.]
MGDTFDWWWMGGDHYDRKQQREIDNLASDHARSNARMRKSLEAQRRANLSLETRVERLERALAATVELEDVREELTQHADAALVRRYARDVVAQLAAFGGQPRPAPLPVPPDVAGYWLHPASRALDAELHGDDDAARSLFAQARDRDPRATDVFRAALTGLRGPGGLPVGAGERLWDDGRMVTADERALWGAVATGRLGQDARQTLIASVRRRAGFETDRAAARQFILGTLQLQPADSDNPLTAGRGLAAIAQLVEASVALAAPTPGTAETMPVPEGLPTTQTSLPAHPVAAVDPDDGGSSTPNLPADSLAELLASTVVRGAPDEQSTISRMHEIRQALSEAGIGEPQPNRGDEHAGTVRELLAHDLTGDGTSAEDRARRRLALDVVAGELTELAHGWHQRIGDAKRPATKKVRVNGVEVTVGPDGPVNRWVSRLETAGDRQSAWMMPAAAGVGAGALTVAIVAAVASATWLWPVAGLAALGAAATAIKAVVTRRNEQPSQESLLHDERRIERAQRDLARQRADEAEAHQGAAAHLATIDRVLGPRAG